MFIITSLVWAALLAFTVYQLTDHRLRSRLASRDDDSYVVTTSVDPGQAATVTFLFGLAAPFFLYRSFGWRGALGGVALLFFAGVGNLGTLIALALVAPGSLR